MLPRALGTASCARVCPQVISAAAHGRADLAACSHARVAPVCVCVCVCVCVSTAKTEATQLPFSSKWLTLSTGKQLQS